MNGTDNRSPNELILDAAYRAELEALNIRSTLNVLDRPFVDAAELRCYACGQRLRKPRPEFHNLKVVK